MQNANDMHNGVDDLPKERSPVQSLQEMLASPRHSPTAACMDPGCCTCCAPGKQPNVVILLVRAPLHFGFGLSDGRICREVSGDLLQLLDSIFKRIARTYCTINLQG